MKEVSDRIDIFLYRFKEFFMDIYREIKWAWQRVFRGYDDRAYWGLDEYLADIALPVIKWLRDYRCGSPIIEDNVDVHSRWDKELDKMIVSFELMKDVDEEMKPENQQKIEEGLKSFGEHFRRLWN